MLSLSFVACAVEENGFCEVAEVSPVISLFAPFTDFSFPPFSGGAKQLQVPKTIQF